jgi:hypothetical protein
MFDASVATSIDVSYMGTHLLEWTVIAGVIGAENTFQIWNLSGIRVELERIYCKRNAKRLF